MTATVSIDEQGRVLIPKELREALHLKSGSELNVTTKGHELILTAETPDRKSDLDGEVVWKDGVPVWRVKTDAVLTDEMVEEMLREDREDRHS